MESNSAYSTRTDCSYIAQGPNSWTLLGHTSQEFSSLLFTVTCTNGFPPPLSKKSGLKRICKIIIVHGNLNSENSQDYAQKLQRNCPIMNSASGKSFIGVWNTLHCFKNIFLWHGHLFAATFFRCLVYFSAQAFKESGFSTKYWKGILK